MKKKKRFVKTGGLLLLAAVATVSVGCESNRGMTYHHREVNVWRWNHDKGARELVRSDLIQTGTGRTYGHPIPAPIPSGWIEPSGAK